MRSYLTIFILITIFSWSYAQNPFDLDTTFQVDMDGHASMYYMNVGDYWVEENGMIIIVGGFEHFINENLPRQVVRLHPDGNLDHSFYYEPPHLGATRWPTRIDKHNGMYYIGHYHRPGVSRIFPDGAVDTTFKFPVDSFFLHEVQVADLYVYSDGRVLIAGNFWKTPTEDWGLLRLNTDGSIDTSFHVTITDKFVYYIQPLPNGKFLLGGLKSDMAFTRKGLWRIHPDGTLDTSFNINAINGVLSLCWHTELTPGGKILAAGIFNISGYPNTLNLVRFYEDGRIDSSFNFSVDYNNMLGRFFQYEEYILVGGSFSELNGRPYNCLAALDTLGNPDTTYFGSLGPDSTQWYPDKGLGGFKKQGEKLLLHGSFISFSGHLSFQLVRLYGLSVGIKEKEKFILILKICNKLILI